MTTLVGVESGGTRTHLRIVRVADDKDREVMNVELNSILSSDLTDAEIKACFDEIFAAIMAKGSDHETHVWIGAAGYSGSSHARFERNLSPSAHALKGKVGIANDAVSILLAHEAELVVVVAGTGSVAMARTPGGEVLTIGMDGWVAADYGSAFWMGLEGVRAAYKSFEGGGHETTLVGRLIDRYGGIVPIGSAGLSGPGSAHRAAPRWARYQRKISHRQICAAGMRRRTPRR